MATFTLHYFATARSFTNKASEQLPAPLPLNSLFSELETRYPGIRAKVLVSCAVTLNLDYVDVDDETAGPQGTETSAKKDETLIKPGDEVAIIPPVSSG
jgi:molybdopterin synthase sulfur carrier subunit